MNKKILLLALSLNSSMALAEGCDVMTRSQSPAAIPVVGAHTCYQYEGMPADALGWSCSNESKEMLTSSKQKVAQCAEGYQATCSAKLTQETLANPRSASKEGDGKTVNVPDNARIVTRYYEPGDLRQAKIDCESGGGQWQAR